MHAFMMFTHLPSRIICFYPLLHCLLLLLSVCLPVPHSLQTASLKLFFFFSLLLCIPHLPLLPPCTRSQSLGDGPVSSWFWTQWRRLQSQKPFGPRAQPNSKQHQSVPSPSFSCMPAHWSHIRFIANSTWTTITAKVLGLKSTQPVWLSVHGPFKSIHPLYSNAQDLMNSMWWVRCGAEC